MREYIHLPEYRCCIYLLYKDAAFRMYDDNDLTVIVHHDENPGTLPPDNLLHIWKITRHNACRVNILRSGNTIISDVKTSQHIMKIIEDKLKSL